MNRRNWFAMAGLVYVAVWIVGLLIESDTPNTSVPVADLTTYFLAHRHSHLLQSYLIDGVAGVAILMFTAMLTNLFYTVDDNQNATFAYILFGAGVAAATVSLAQAGMQAALTDSELLTGDAASIRLLLMLINATDTFKLLALSLLSGTTSALVLRTGLLPRWLGWLGAILSFALIFGGLHFLVDSPSLFFVLVASLPLLLLWVGSISVAMLLHRRVETIPTATYTHASR